MESGSQVDRDAAIGIPRLDREHIKRHDHKDQETLLERLDKLAPGSAPKDVVHRVEEDRHQNIHNDQHDRQRPVGSGLVGIPPSVTDDVGDDKGNLKDDGVKQDKIQMFQPSLDIALVHEIREHLRCSW